MGKRIVKGTAEREPKDKSEAECYVTEISCMLCLGVDAQLSVCL